MRFGVLAVVFCFLTSCADEVMLVDPVLPPSKASPEIFKVYREYGDAELKGGWASGMDMSGVSFNMRETATLITRRHVVMAKHFQRKVGAKVVFHDRGGKYLLRKIVKVQGAYGDVAVGLLNDPVPVGYRVYPLPEVGGTKADYLGRPVLVTDQHRRLFFHKVRTTSSVGIAFEHDVEDTHGWGKKLVGGDSGNPSFLIVGKELVLIETHTSGGPGGGPFYGAASIQEKLREVVAALDPAYQIRTVKIR